MSKIFIAFDSETGGLSPKTSDILTLYMAVLDQDLKVLDEIDLKLKPNTGLPRADAGALKVNGINIQAHMEDPKTITNSEAKKVIVEFIKKHLKKKGRYSNLVPLGQNLQFDVDFIQEHLIPKDEWDSMIHYGKIDTKMVADFLKDAGWFPQEIGNLGSMVDFLGVPKRNAHSAKEDTLMCIDVYKRILEIMKAKKDGGQTVDIISLLEAE